MTLRVDTAVLTATVGLPAGLLGADAAQAGVLWFDSFEDDRGRWSTPGSSVHTVNEANHGKRSVTFRRVTGDGDAKSPT
jgi:hypothetical protein